ncbi:hypothetical protein [Streptomyces sp. NPDC056323]|uniref:hypothetical protein n=1 Tax=Streptomyces sp. NPDC056323 TaxID=3345784 RepID=UPI0035DA2D24
MVFALADVQAEIDVDGAGVDHVRPPVVLLPGFVHGTDRHIHITKSLPACGQDGGHAPNQRSVSASGLGDTTPRITVDKGGSHADPGGREPRCGTTKKVMGARYVEQQLFADAGIDLRMFSVPATGVWAGERIFSAVCFLMVHGTEAVRRGLEAGRQAEAAVVVGAAARWTCLIRS